LPGIEIAIAEVTNSIKNNNRTNARSIGFKRLPSYVICMRTNDIKNALSVTGISAVIWQKKDDYYFGSSVEPMSRINSRKRL
jgi:hypothetical protein